MKKNLLLGAALICACTMFAQEEPKTVPDGSVKQLLPQGVAVSITNDANLVKEKNLVIAGDSVNGYKAFFAATDAEHGTELWVTDGTPEGTKMVKDIYPGNKSSNPTWLTQFNDKVIFSATGNDKIGTEVWISDGTEEGTYLVADVNEVGSSNPMGFCQINEKYFIFAATDFEAFEYGRDVAGRDIRWLFISDGIADDDLSDMQGTFRINECDVRCPSNLGIGSNGISGFHVRVGRQVFFHADSQDGLYGEELWVTDGTREGTHMVKDINVEWADTAAGTTVKCDAKIMMNFYNEKLYFMAYSDEHANEYWASDGTEDGTYEIFNQNTVKGTHICRSGETRDGSGENAVPSVFDGYVYNRGSVTGTNTGSELYRTNCEKGNFEFCGDMRIVPDSSASSFPDLFPGFDGCVYFNANTGTAAEGGYDIELCRFDPVTKECRMQFNDFNIGGHGSSKKAHVEAGGCFYGTMRKTGENTDKIWLIESKDDTEPTLVYNMLGWGTNDNPHTFRNCGGICLFVEDGANANAGQLFACSYKGVNYKASRDNELLNIEYRTRQQIKDGVDPHDWKDPYSPEEAISNVRAAKPAAVKLFRNGQIYIIKNGSIFNGQGARMF